MLFIISLLPSFCLFSMMYLLPFFKLSHLPLPVRSDALILPYASVINGSIYILLLVSSATFAVLQSPISVLVICGGIVFVGFLLIILSKDGNKIVTEIPVIYLGQHLVIYNLFSRIGGILVSFASFSICVKIVIMDNLGVLPGVTRSNIMIGILTLMAFVTIICIVTVIIRKRDAKITIVPTSTNETGRDL